MWITRLNPTDQSCETSSVAVDRFRCVGISLRLCNIQTTFKFIIYTFIDAWFPRLIVCLETSFICLLCYLSQSATIICVTFNLQYWHVFTVFTICLEFSIKNSYIKAVTQYCQKSNLYLSVITSVYKVHRRVNGLYQLFPIYF